ncbi:MAG: tyrosine-type recombinase/integrase [Methanosarcinales archaeon]|nr:tyrosine-type recombinase/integrase [Methanosarcinales archaeon]
MKQKPQLTGNSKKILIDYDKSLKLNAFKDATINTKLWKICIFLKYYNDKPADKITREDVQAYILHRRETRKPKTVHNDIIDIRLFFKWLKPDNDFFEGIKTKPQKNRLPTTELMKQDDVVQMLTACENQRDRALITILWDSGARVGEILNLNIRDVQLDEYGAVIVVDGKTGMRRLRLINAVPDLQLWLNQHPNKNNPDAPLFVTSRKYGNEPKCLDIRTVQNMVKTIAEHAGIKKNVHPHAFRHGRLTDLVKLGFQESSLRIVAGWEDDSAMPAVYIHMSGADVESQMLAAHGIIEEDKEEVKDNLQPIVCPRCKTKNPHDSKYCSTCSMILDAEIAMDLEQQSAPVNDNLTALMNSKIEELVEARLNEMLKGVK